MLSSLHVSFMDRGWKPNVEISPNCPRCGSSNTKFCYYNNYSLTQPRYFCKGCRRYWTKGGSLRNVPVGGGCRKNRRGKSLRVASSTNDVAHSKSLGYVHGYKGIEPCSSSTMPDGSHIDLALVYANFLNPHHQDSMTTSSSGFKIQELGNDHFDPSLEFTTNMDSSSVQLRNIGAGCVNAMEASLNENDLMMYQQANDYKIQECTTVTTHDTINYGLPPLPGEEILWPNSSHMMDHNQTLQETQQAILGPETQDPNTLLFGNWSPFDLSSDDTFSRS